ncbi:oxygenase MpaB family protein [Streptomyces sp. NPDC056061]|uniref:oxygenase MpaB family protein n=1 Tax=Streptomyces sp. NPDC056061 TaxID=3345700 RepID=UPI0035E1E777
MKRYDRLKEIQRLDPERDFLRIYRITATYEFPWDIARALELALYRTYAVPSIGQLLAKTGELTDRSQKRYDDTALLLDTVVEHGFAGEPGRTALRRINQMHRSYDISNDDMRYVLCTFVVTPKRWLDRYGWRRLSAHEMRACAAYYRTLGAHMGIKDLPETYQDFERTLDSYEAEHFGWDEGGRRVSDATLELMASWYPGVLAPVARRAALALLDDALLRAFRYERPGPVARNLTHGALRLRARALRLLPSRTTAHYARQNPEIKGYPDGYEVSGLGTFPTPGLRGCPVPHRRRDEPSAKE